MPVDDWNTDHTQNVIVEGEDIDEGMLPAGLNDFLRKMVAALKVWRNNSYCIDKNVTIAASGGAAPSSPAEGHLWMEY